MDTKICTKCNKEFPISNFTTHNSKKNSYPSCNKCVSVWTRQWYSKNKTRRRQWINNRRKLLRIEMINAYGGKCNCCGETEIKFLAIDHINGEGRKDRERFSGYEVFMLHLKQSGYPKDKYQVLCHNCNAAKGFYGQCPHKEKLCLGI